MLWRDEGRLYHRELWQLLVAIMLSAQSTDKQVDKVLPGLYERFPTLDSVARAPAADIEEGIRSIGLYKNKAKNIKKCCQQILEDFGGEVPDSIGGLLKLAGVGRKTATLFLAGRLWNSRSHGRYPCVSDFEAARLGGGKESSGRGEGAGKGFAGGTLEPD